MSVFFFLPKQVIQAAHGPFLHRGKDVRVDAERNADMAVSKQFLHDFRVHLHFLVLIHQIGVGLLQVVSVLATLNIRSHK